MKVINVLIISSICLFLWQCKEEDETNFSDSEVQFVRFSVFEKDGVVVTYPQIPTTAEEIDSLQFDGVAIKLPVKLSQVPTEEEVNIGFEVQNSALIEGVDYLIYPQNKELKFQGNQLVDTVSVQLKHRLENAEFMDITLTSASNPDIHLGYSREVKKLDRFKVYWDPTQKLPITFNTNRLTISNAIGSEVAFQLQFPKGFLIDELQGLPLFSRNNNFQYSLTQNVLSENQWNYPYTFTNQEQLPDAEVSETLTINQYEGYIFGVNPILSITKPFSGERMGTPANFFFNTNDPFFRLFGKSWITNSAGECQWRTFSTFTKPVTVEPNSEFDSDGDGYHDFKVGFVGNSPPIGTNPFNTRRYYTGASVESPAYNIYEALEFFPDNSNPNQGTVNVVAQPLSFIRNSDDQVMVLFMSGGGNYYYNEVLEVYEMYLEVHYNETSIGGGEDVVHQLYLTNEDVEIAPEPLNVECAMPIEL